MPGRRRPDRIILSGLTARGHHGVFDQERRDGQDFVVDVELELDLAEAAATDDLSETVNYAEVAEDVMAMVQGEPVDLIETLAGRIADMVLDRPRVEAVRVRVHKPQAPVRVPLGDLAVELYRERDVPVVIAIGANLGEPEQTVRRSVIALRRVRGLRGVRVSPPFGSQPVGGPDQPPYVNAVAVGRTRLAPESLLRELHRIEDEFGRTRTVQWGPRTLDLDLIQVGEPGESTEVRSDRADLQLPHPRAAQRAFVVAPWHAVDPQARLRTTSGISTVEELLQRLDRTGVWRLGQGPTMTQEPGQ